jgi:asparagine synthase (glutamine-hydrolysing)
MPGLVGVATVRPDRKARDVFAAVLSAVCEETQNPRTEAVSDPGGRWALAHVHLGILRPEDPISSSDGLHIALHGELHNEEDLRQRLPEEARATPAGDVASLIRSLYRSHGAAFLPWLQGTFCGAVVDEGTGQVILFNDRLGSYALYWFADRTHLAFAPRLSALLRDPAVDRVLDPRAVGDYVNFGFLLGDRTLLKSVKLLSPGSLLTYSWQDGTYRLERYARIADLFSTASRTHGEYLEAVCDAFNRAAHRSLTGTPRVGLALSGGLDSRTILSAACGLTAEGAAGRVLTTYTLGAKGCADEVIAEKLSHLAGTSHRFFELDARYLADYLPQTRRMVSLTDGMYLSHGLTEMLALRFLEQAGIGVLVRGHGGELAKAGLAWPLETDERVYRCANTADLIAYLADRMSYLSRGLSFKDLFPSDWVQAVEGAGRDSLEEAVAGVELSPADLCGYLYLSEHTRRWVGISLELFRSHTEVRLPYLDTEFLSALFSGRPEWREGTGIHLAIMRRNRPGFLRIRDSNTGAPCSAGPALEALLRKMNGLLKRLNVYGYRHYHRHDVWMRREFIHAVEEELLKPGSLTGDLLRAETLREIIAATKEGRANHALFLQILLNLELWWNSGDREATAVEHAV